MSNLISEHEVARILNIAPKTLQSWRQNGFGPKYLKLSNKTIRYKTEDIQNWLQQRTNEG